MRLVPNWWEEVYPVNTVTPNWDGSYSPENLVDVPEELYARYVAACTEFSAVQVELETLFESVAEVRSDEPGHWTAGRGLNTLLR